MQFFASNAGFWGAVSAMAAVAAMVAWLGDARRARRASPDAVGFMPWTTIFLIAMFVAAVAGVFALKDWLSPV